MLNIIEIGETQDTQAQKVLFEQLKKSIEAYTRDHENAIKRSEFIEKEAVKREEERISDYRKIALFGRA